MSFVLLPRGIIALCYLGAKGNLTRPPSIRNKTKSPTAGDFVLLGVANGDRTRVEGSTNPSVTITP